MVSPARLAANRLNARRSTGPRTPAGRQAVAHNAVRHGLYATAALLPALGETAEAWDEFRASVVAGLHPDGAAEHALADRVAHLLWRQRRVAAFAPGADAPLPPDPDAVTGRGVEPHAPLIPDAPPAARLARARAIVAAARRGLAHARAGAAVVIGTTKGNTIGIRKGNTVAQPLRVALPPPRGDEDAHGGPVRPHSSAPS